VSAALLLRPEGPVADEYARVADVAELSLNGGPVIVTLETIDQALNDRRNERLGLEIGNNTPLSAVEAYLGQIDLISVVFPSFSDGRGLSLAKRLRRAGFAGTLRASGPLISDQFAEALACGFDEVALPEASAARQPAEQWGAALHAVREHYQTGYGEGESILQKRLAARGSAA
jgi:uncharacterized protein (DUF934 family)